MMSVRPIWKLSAAWCVKDILSRHHIEEITAADMCISLVSNRDVQNEIYAPQ